MVKATDTDPLTRIFAENRERLLRLARDALSKWNCQEAAEGVVQDAWIKAVEGGETPSPHACREQVLRWVAGIIRNVARNRGRRERHRHTAPLGDSGSDAAVRSHEPAVLAALEYKELIEVLTPAERDVLLGRETEGASLRQIARVRDCKVGTVKTLLKRARKKLRRSARGRV